MLRAAVLAGGRSSRMGCDKALLQLQGVTLLDRAISLLQQCGVDQVLVSGRPGHPLGVPDLLPHAGPPGAVLSLLAWLEARGQLDGQPLLLVPVDMPLLTLPLLQGLITALQTNSCCHYFREVFPCAVPASPVLCEHLRMLFAGSHSLGGERSMRALFAFLNGRAVPLAESDRGLLANVNTPEEWVAVCERAGKY